MLTPEQIQKYVEDGGVHCPYCGSTDLDCSLMNQDGPIAFQEISCNGCDKQWTDIYKLVDMTPTEV